VGKTGVTLLNINSEVVIFLSEYRDVELRKNVTRKEERLKKTHPEVKKKDADTAR